MFCSHCGRINAPHALYCVHDGYPLNQQDTNGCLHVGSHPYCNECGVKINHPAARYCVECGRSLEIYVPSATQSVQHTYFDLELVRKTLPGLLLSIGVLLGIGQIFMILLKRIGDSDLFRHFPLPIYQQMTDSLNVLDISLFVHLTSIFMTITNDGFSQQISFLSIGMVYMVFLAAFALMAGGCLIKWLNPLIEEWKGALLVAAGYAAFLGIITPLAGVTNIEANQAQRSFDFNMVSAVINGLFIGFIFSYAGMILRKGALKEKMRLLVHQRALYYGTFVFIKGCGIMLLLSFILTAQYELPEELEEQWEPTGSLNYMNVAFVFRMAAYLFNLGLFNSVVINNSNLEEKTTYSFLPGISLDQEMMDQVLFIPPDFFASSEIIIIVVTAVLFIWIGRSLVISGQQSIMKTIVMYSVIFAVIMTFFSVNVSLNQVTQVQHTNQAFQDELSHFAGFEMIRTFFMSMIYAAITAFIGALTRKLF
ncbi:Double zinc ribbon [Lentibacillus halodurans]|uniref:Double zinc ribbon n=1 Tax=Lentibacillus halodurans TaxID=237679 RepID=A0A1I0WGF5_9BACI|nr:zinc ribbon domain-containing protein [Lentibacillus halodurans]SFA87865.1 Double zinc ribbon [Lentibacillus halodurans]